MIDLTCIIFSKDRACQLDLLLNTIKLNLIQWRQVKFKILYTYSSTLYKSGYEAIKQLHPEFEYIKETNFKYNTIDICNNITTEYLSFLVDDDIFINKLDLESPEINEFVQNKNITCVSPRINPDVNYCYTAKIMAPPPTFIHETLRIWDWTSNTLVGDWCYPPSVSAFHIFRNNEIKQLVNIGQFAGPNSFEGMLHNYYPKNNKLMICFNESKVYCCTLNRVQTENQNYTENTHPLDVLNNIFLSGRRLSATANNGLKVNMCHGPAHYIFD